eukprot:SAG11_NODE_11775_length_739_cov_0.720313_1_plen_126_part_00
MAHLHQSTRVMLVKFDAIIVRVHSVGNFAPMDSMEPQFSFVSVHSATCYAQLTFCYDLTIMLHASNKLTHHRHLSNAIQAGYCANVIVDGVRQGLHASVNLTSNVISIENNNIIIMLISISHQKQ